MISHVSVSSWALACGGDKLVVGCASRPCRVCFSSLSVRARAHRSLFFVRRDFCSRRADLLPHTALRTSHAHPHDRTQITDTVSREAGALTADDRCVCVVDDATLIVVLRTGPGLAGLMGPF